jgi:hypothetical protein
MSNVDPKEVLILELGAEGGSLHLVGCQDQSGWKFQVRTNEIWDDDDIPEAAPPRPWFRQWHEALEQLETYPWRSLHPLHVEPAFREQLVGAFLGVPYVDETDPGLQELLRRWAVILLDIRPSPVRDRYPSRTLGEHPSKGGLIVAKTGRYGPFLCHNNVFANLPAGKTPDTITLEEAVSLVDAQANRQLRLRRPRKDVGSE